MCAGRCLSNKDMRRVISEHAWRPITLFAPNYTDHDGTDVVVGFGKGEALSDGAVRMLRGCLKGIHVQTGREL